VAVNAHSRESMRIEGAGHDFGIKTDTPEISNNLIEVTEMFFKRSHHERILITSNSQFEKNIQEYSHAEAQRYIGGL
jgi:hypothetical protein